MGWLLNVSISCLGIAAPAVATVEFPPPLLFFFFFVEDLVDEEAADGAGVELELFDLPFWFLSYFAYYK